MPTHKSWRHKLILGPRALCGHRQCSHSSTPSNSPRVKSSAIRPLHQLTTSKPVRNLGGKLGTQIAEHFKTESLTDLLNVSLGQFQTLLPDDTATWVYNVIRGHDRSLVEPKSSIKSMLSAKSFREPIRSLQEAQSWLQVFIADISSRLDDEPTGRRPKTMTLHFSTKNGPTRNKQLSIPAAGKFNKDALLKLADRLLDTVVAAEPGAFPCTGMSLQVAGLEDREEGNMGIGAFLLKGQQAADANNKRRMSTPVAVEEEEEKKRPRLDCGIGRFFTAKDPQVMLDSDEGKKSPPALPDTDPNSFPTFYCPECAADLPGEEQEQAEHKDWHFAKALEQEDRAAARRPPPPPPPAPPRGGGNGNKKKKNGGGGKNNKLEKGQSLLKF
jgi:DNA polymerase eta